MSNAEKKLAKVYPLETTPYRASPSVGSAIKNLSEVNAYPLPRLAQRHLNNAMKDLAELRDMEKPVREEIMRTNIYAVRLQALCEKHVPEELAALREEMGFSGSL